MGSEFYAAFQVAKLALAGIRSCVDMLNEGTTEIQRVKKDITQGVESAKALYSEVTGFWGWFKKLLGSTKSAQAPAPSAAPAPVETTAAPAKEEYVDFVPDEDEIVEQFLTHFTNFIDAQTTILDTIEDQREKILNVWNPKQNNRKVAIELIRHERKINDMAMELSELMASAPRRLGSVREQFQEKLDIVVEAQSRAKERARIRRLQESWQRDLLKNHRIDRAIAVATVFLILLWIWGMLLSLRWLVTTPDGLSLP